MIEKIGLWSGFSVVFFEDKVEATGEKVMISLLGRGDPREDPNVAWSDAVHLGKGNETYLKGRSITPIAQQQGICPAHLLW